MPLRASVPPHYPAADAVGGFLVLNHRQPLWYLWAPGDADQGPQRADPEHDDSASSTTAAVMACTMSRYASTITSTVVAPATSSTIGCPSHRVRRFPLCNKPNGHDHGAEDDQGTDHASDDHANCSDAIGNWPTCGESGRQHHQL